MTTIIPKYDPHCKYTPSSEIKVIGNIAYRIWTNDKEEKYVMLKKGTFRALRGIPIPWD